MEENGAKNGNAWTPEGVFRTYATRVYNLARRMLGNDADAEDVTQEVILQVVRKLDTFRGEAELGTWLYQVAVHAALAHRKKRALREEHERQDPLDLFREDGHHTSVIYPWSITPEAVAQNREMTQLVEKAITNLPEVYRDVYILADVEGLPSAQISDMLGLSLPAVKSRLHRGRLLVRQTLAPHFEEVLP